MTIANTIHDRLNEDEPLATQLFFYDNSFVLELEDGRRQTFSYSVSPRLTLAIMAERRSGLLIMAGYGIEWEALDEHLSVPGLIAGKTSNES